ncbi:MAG: hypothetical protein AAB553_03195 [Patescibacteria group bacterium]
MSLTKAEKQKIREEEKYRQAVAASVSSSKAVQKHGVPLLLSILIPGLGQLVKGQIKKGLLIIFAPLLAFILLMFVSLIDSGATLFSLFSQLWLGYIVFYIWQLIDAYNN